MTIFISIEICILESCCYIKHQTLKNNKKNIKDCIFPLRMQHQSADSSHNTIFIGGLPGSAKESKLRSHFEQFGAIETISMVQNNKKGNLSKGYALITYSSEAGYTSAVKKPEHYLFKRVVSCQPYLQGDELADYLEDLNSRRLFVKYIPKNVKNTSFEDIFAQFGEVDFGYVVKDPKTGNSRGFGYITFKSQEVARDVEKLKFLKINGNRKLKIFPYKRRGSNSGAQKSSHKMKSSFKNSQSGASGSHRSERNQARKEDAHSRAQKNESTRNNYQRKADINHKALKIRRKETQESYGQDQGSFQLHKASKGSSSPWNQNEQDQNYQAGPVPRRRQYEPTSIEWDLKPSSKRYGLASNSTSVCAQRHTPLNLRFNACPDLQRTNRLVNKLHLLRQSAGQFGAAASLEQSHPYILPVFYE